MSKIKVTFVETNCKKNGPIKQTLNIIRNMDKEVFEPSLVRNPALLLSAPAAARDRRVYWPVTQHSGAAYPACLAAATRRNGGEPV